MNAAQRRTYFGLWNAACRVHHWNPEDDHQRQRVTFAATGETSSRGLDQEQITLLFKKLRWLADPANFAKALADSDPVAALAENKRKQVIWRIEHECARFGLKEEWLVEISRAKCAVHQVKNWRKLPMIALLNLSMTVESRTSEEAHTARQRKKTSARPMQPACTQDARCLELPF